MTVRQTNPRLATHMIPFVD